MTVYDVNDVKYNEQGNLGWREEEVVVGRRVSCNNCGEETGDQRKENNKLKKRLRDCGGVRRGSSWRRREGN